MSPTSLNGEHPGAGVARKQGGGGAEFLVDVLQGFEDEFAGAEVEDSGRVVAEEDFGVFGDGAGDRNPLLFAAGELGGEVVDAVGQAYNFQGFGWGDGVTGNFGDQGHVFFSGDSLATNSPL